jgi:hypothetical protein
MAAWREEYIAACPSHRTDRIRADGPVEEGGNLPHDGSGDSHGGAVMPRKKADPDFTLRLQGLEVPEGALGADDLLQLGKFINGLGSASADLEGGYIFKIHGGCTRSEICFPRREPPLLPGHNPIRSSLIELFKNGGFNPDDGWKVPIEIRDSLRHWAQKKVTTSIRIPSSGEKAFCFKFTPKKVHEFNKKIAETPIKKAFIGKLRVLDGADSEFELHFDNKKLVCRFPENVIPSGLYFEKFVEVVAWVKGRPSQGQWKAVSTESVRILPEPPHLEMEFPTTGLIPPANKVPGGFNLNHFFLGAQPEDIDVLCQALELCEDQS